MGRATFGEIEINEINEVFDVFAIFLMHLYVTPLKKTKGPNLLKGAWSYFIAVLFSGHQKK